MKWRKESVRPYLVYGFAAGFTLLFALPVQFRIRAQLQAATCQASAELLPINVKLGCVNRDDP
jgi:hypothetical protein